MTVKTYDINGDFYAVYFGVTELSKNTRLSKFVLTQRVGMSAATVTTTLSIQEAKLEVEL